MTLQRNVDTWERAASIAIGAALLAAASRRRQRATSAASAAAGLAALGAGLVARGASGYCPVNAAVGRGADATDTRRALGGSRGIRLEESMTIARAPEDVFAFWQDVTQLPVFMRHLERVEVIDERRSHWIVRGPGGIRLQWDAEIINEIPPELIAWRTLHGADVVSAGSVRFTPRRGGTEVAVTMQYNPPGGKAGAALAWMAGRSPSSHVREDLRRLKQILETGEAPTVKGQPQGARSAKFNVLKWVNA